MMEFTYEGMVRQGFGFYNPNHAAALFCALFPFFFAACLGIARTRFSGVLRLLAGGVSVALVVMTALTFSRTGMVVLLAEAAYLIFRRMRCTAWKIAQPVLAGMVLLFLVTGALGRFKPDRALANRPLIWKAGAELVAANPWQGIGLGHSGQLASAFLLPDRITCRTLVNSHLTVLAEQGVGIGMLWFIFIAVALASGRQRPVVWTAFCGLVVSSTLASVFDWDALLHPRTEAGIPGSDRLLGGFQLLLFLVLGGMLWASGFSWRKTALACAGCGLTLLAVVAGFHSAQAPVMRDGWAVIGDGRVRVYYDDAFTLREVVSVVRPRSSGGCFHLRPDIDCDETPPLGVQAIYLFGTCIEFAESLPTVPLVVVAPPGAATLPSNVAQLLVPAGTAESTLLSQARQRNIPILFY